MKTALLIHLVSCCACLYAHETCSHPWTLAKEENGEIKCECGDQLGGIVKCDSNSFELKVWQSYCMTYSESLNVTVGHCAMTFLTLHELLDVNNISDLNNAMCGKFDRTGQMCGGCKEGYSHPVYSYSMACVKCSDYKYNWLKYIAVAFLPLTLFYVLVLVFRISALSGNMDTFILISQLISGSGIMRLYSLNLPSLSLIARRVTQPIITIYGIWNLDFFRTVYEPFCLHPNLTSMQVLILDYVIAVYPLLLIFITYICVSLHDKYRIVVFLWGPFYRCFAHIRREWHIRKSLVDVFVTFLLLSFLKIANVSSCLLTPSVLYNIHGQQLRNYAVYFDGTISYFSKGHIPYAILAIIMTFFFNIVPVILLWIYPCQTFQRCLNCFPCQLQVLHTFMDTFHGTFKTTPYDYRYFAALYLLLRIVNLVVLCSLQNTLYLPLISVIYIIVSILVSFMKPRRYYWYNFIDVLLLTSVTIGILILFIMNVAALDIAPRLSPPENHSYMILLMTPAMYFVLLLLYSLTPKAVFNWCRMVYAYTVGVWKFKFRQAEQLSVQEHNEISPLLDEC